MQAFVDSRKFSKAELRQLNVCRCFLKAVSVSDICTADGRDITEEAKAGIPVEGFSDDPIWPRLDNLPAYQPSTGTCGSSP